MNKKILVIIGVLVIAGGVYMSMSFKDETMMDRKISSSDISNITEEKEQMAEDEALGEMKDETMMKKEETDTMMAESDTVAKAGSYEAYSPEKIVRAETGDVVLFFHASWCPSCRGLNTDIENNIGAIPAGVSILKVDYDKETELKKKYGITYQHTLVQVDKDGNLIKKWSGSPKLSSLAAQIQ